jgi:hypothetical protein
MKAQQRKQLDKNELADRLVRWWRGDPEHKTKSSPVWWAVLGLIALAVILYVAWHYYAKAALDKSSTAWADVDLATENSRLEEIAEANRGTEPGWAAKAQLARAALQKGLDELGSEVLRSGAVASIEKARDWYGQLAKDATSDVELQREAGLGMAKAEEALIGIPKAENSQEMRGTLAKTLELYKDVASKFGDSIQGKEAAKRAAELEANKDKVEAFYTDLNKSLSTPPAPPIMKLPPESPYKTEPPKVPSPSIPGSTPPIIAPLPTEPKPKTEVAPQPKEVPGTDIKPLPKPETPSPAPSKNPK